MSKRYVLLAVLLAFSFIVPAVAENFPTRPITWIVPFTPGGITDTTSRLVADEM